SGQRAAQAVRLTLAGAAVFLAYRGMRGAFADHKLVDVFGTAWMPYSDALGPWFVGGLSFLFGLAPPDYLYRPIAIFWASLLALGQHTQFITFFFCGWLLAFLAVVLSN